MMILYHGDTSTIKAEHWYMLELRSERTAEEILKRVLLALGSAFRSDAVEIFVPELRTRENSFTLLTESYVFVRADDPAKISKLRRVTGVQGVVTGDGSFRVSAFLEIENSYVKDLQDKVQDNYYRRGAAIYEGAFVKILDGHDRDLYGYVTSMADGRACVTVHLNTKLWFVDTSVYNLLDCSDIEPQFRVYYYGPAVERMIQENPERAAILLKPDLFYDEARVNLWLFGGGEEGRPVPQLETVRTSRERTPSRFVRSLVMQGERDIHKLLHLTVEAIQQGHLRCTRSTLILWHILRTEMLNYAFTEEQFASYSELVDRHGDEFNLSPKEVDAAFPALAKGEIVFPAPKAKPTPDFYWRTTTAFTLSHLGYAKHNLSQLIDHIYAELSQGRFRAPKHLHSMVDTIRRTVVRIYRKTNPKITYAQIVEKEGAEMLLTVAMVRERYPDMEALLLSIRAQQIRFSTRALSTSLPTDTLSCTITPPEASNG